MTIKEFADAHGVTAQAVYKRLKEKGYSLNQLKKGGGSGNTRELTPEGEEILNRLYQVELNPQPTFQPVLNPVDNQVENVDNPVDNPVESRIEQLTAEKAALEAENTQLKAEIDKLKEGEASARKTIEQLTETIATLTATQQKTLEGLTAAQRLADQAQQLHAMQIKALPSGGVKGWIRKIFKGGKAEE